MCTLQHKTYCSSNALGITVFQNKTTIQPSFYIRTEEEATKGVNRKIKNNPRNITSI
jgi:hypothetical protein